MFIGKKLKYIDAIFPEKEYCKIQHLVQSDYNGSERVN